MKTLVDRLLELGKEPRLTNGELDRPTNERTVNNLVFTDADCYFWGNFEDNPSGQGNFLPVTVRLILDYPPDASTNPTWDTLIVGYNNLNLKKPDVQVVVELVQVDRKNRAMTVLATFDSNEHTVARKSEGYIRFNANFDFHQNIYFLKLELTRKIVSDFSTIAYRVGLAHSNK